LHLYYSTLQTLQKLCYKFVWDDKRDKISRKLSQKRVGNGGIGVPNLSIFIQALKLSWIRKYFQSNHKWLNVVKVNYPFPEKIYLYGANFPKNQYKGNRF